MSDQVLNKKDPGRTKTIGELVQEKSLEYSPGSPDSKQFVDAIKGKCFDILNDCLESGLRKYPGDFFIVIMNQEEKLFSNYIAMDGTANKTYRKRIFHRWSCPTPIFDQVVFHYNSRTQELDYLWALPSKKKSQFMFDNRMLVLPEEYGLLEHVLDYYNGNLFNKAIKLNEDVEKLFKSTDLLK